MLSAVLRSEVAVKVSINIMSAFVEMRKFLMDNSEIFSRLERVELNQVNTKNRLDEVDQKFEQVFNYIAETREVSQKIIFNPAYSRQCVKIAIRFAKRCALKI